MRCISFRWKRSNKILDGLRKHSLCSAVVLELGVAEGVTLLAGLSIVGIIGTTALYYYGANLRAKSKFAE